MIPSERKVYRAAMKEFDEVMRNKHTRCFVEKVLEREHNVFSKSLENLYRACAAARSRKGKKG